MRPRKFSNSLAKQATLENKLCSARLERATYGFGGRHSIQLSYEHITGLFTLTPTLYIVNSSARGFAPRAPHKGGEAPPPLEPRAVGRGMLLKRRWRRGESFKLCGEGGLFVGVELHGGNKACSHEDGSGGEGGNSVRDSGVGGIHGQ